MYAVGADPDPRFTFANERTFLAWIRTSLALIAAGIALEAFLDDVPASTRRLLAVALVLVGVMSAGASYGRWMSSERALRLERSLPAPALAPVLGFGVAAIGVALVLVIR